jgi:hypothetical protein
VRKERRGNAFVRVGTATFLCSHFCDTPIFFRFLPFSDTRVKVVSKSRMNSERHNGYKLSAIKRLLTDEDLHMLFLFILFDFYCMHSNFRVVLAKTIPLG